MIKKLLITTIVLLLSGCVSQIVSVDDSAKTWIGRPLAELKEVIWSRKSSTYAERIGWQEKTYSLDNGNLVYVEPVRPGCFIHWETDAKGMIRAYKTDGNRCF